jgi:predicted transcriptional regulator
VSYKVATKLTEFYPAPLEQIFGNNRARVLDHLIMMKPFDFSFDELVKILSIDHVEMTEILNHLKTFGLIESSESFKHRLAENGKTIALHKFSFGVAVDNMDKIIENQKNLMVRGKGNG